MTHTRELAVIVGATFRPPPQELVAEAPALDPLAPLLVPPPLALRAELPLPAAMLAPTPQIRRATLGGPVSGER